MTKIRKYHYTRKSSQGLRLKKRATEQIKILDDTAHEEEKTIGHPQGVVAKHREKQIEDGEEQHRREETGQEHTARSRHTDEEAIVDKRGNTCHRDNKRPEVIACGGAANRRIIGK